MGARKSLSWSVRSHRWCLHACITVSHFSSYSSSDPVRLGREFQKTGRDNSHDGLVAGVLVVVGGVIRPLAYAYQHSGIDAMSWVRE